MSLRRLLPTIGLCALGAALLGACLPWSVESPRIAEFVGAGIAGSYGIALTAAGPAEIALLPLPRLGFDGVRLTAGAPDGPALAEGGHLSLQLSLLALLWGRIDVNTLTLDGATITLPADDRDARWSEPLRQLTAALTADGTAHPRRITLTRAIVTGRDPRDGSSQTARDVDLTLSWPLWSAQVDAGGSFTWNDTPTRFSLAGLRVGDLIARGSSPFALGATWPAGTLTAEGTGSLRDGPTLSGRASVRTRSLPETLAWAGTDLALAPLVETFGLEGSFETSGRTLLLPSVRVSLGDNRLEGAGSVSFGERRPAIQATLAAEHLTLSPLVADILRVLGLADPDDPVGSWSTRSLALHSFTQGDLDLRLSAGRARLGPMVLDDVASSLMVREGNIEASLSRANVQGATLKGRVGLTASAADRAETEVRAQGAFDRLDLGALMVDLGQEGWLLGGAQGQFAFEGTGRNAAALVRRLGGRATLSVDGGTIAGLDLADVIHRNGAVAPGALARRNGRTAFERAGVTVRFVDGIGEIADGSLTTSTLTASLRGAISLPARSVAATADLTARNAADAPAPRFAIAGPWDAVAVRALARTEGAPDAGSRGGSVLVPKALRIPAAGTGVGLPAAARAYAP